MSTHTPWLFHPRNEAFSALDRLILCVIFAFASIAVLFAPGKVSELMFGGRA